MSDREILDNGAYLLLTTWPGYGSPAGFRIAVVYDNRQLYEHEAAGRGFVVGQMWERLRSQWIQVTTDELKRQAADVDEPYSRLCHVCQRPATLVKGMVTLIDYLIYCSSECADPEVPVVWREYPSPMNSAHTIWKDNKFRSLRQHDNAEWVLVKGSNQGPISFELGAIGLEEAKASTLGLEPST